VADYNVMEIIGRTRERMLFDHLVKEEKSHFAAVYGRRRIGKTFLIRKHFTTFDFYHTGIANVEMQDQLTAFYKTAQTFTSKTIEQPTNWFDAFDILKKIITGSRKKKKTIFLDELPWLDTPRSNFVAALEYFWNGWASNRNDVLLIVCGSATSWIVKKIFNNRKGLHNRITQKIHLNPFTLQETELFLKSRAIQWNRYQIIKCYMVFGGVPFYLEALEKGKSIDQNIDYLLFDKDGLLHNEHQNLYHALFNNAENYIEIIKILATKNKGLTREELVQKTKLKTGGTLSTILNDLILSDFIKVYLPYGKKVRESLYQLTDAYSLFYYNFLNNKKAEKGSWLQNLDSPKIRAWSGYAFEMVALQHLDKIKETLGISGVQTEISSWVCTKKETNAQIDLIIDRRDQVINLFEIKYSLDNYLITSKYAKELRQKIAVFQRETKTKKAIYFTMLTTYGLVENEHSGMVQNSLTMDNLF
jgi:hypothetical protein